MWKKKKKEVFHCRDTSIGINSRTNFPVSSKSSQKCLAASIVKINKNKNNKILLAVIKGEA